MLEFQNVSYQYPSEDFDIIDHLSFAVEPGSFHCIIGISGCGKSTIFRMTNGLLKPKAGTILVEGKSIVGRKHYCGYMPQKDLLFPWRTVGENVALPLEIQGELTRAERRDRAEAALADVGLAGCGSKMPDELSGGMRQRIMIAMALSCNPKLLIADEPTTALDVTVQAQILDLMNALKDELDMAIILITHDLGVVAEMCKYVYVMYAGQIVETAAIDDLLDHPLHPYTQGLLNSMPERWLGGERLYSIPGTVPPPGTKITGCKFADRCQYCTQLCRMAPPPLRRLDEHRSVRCLYCNGEGVQGGAVS